MFLHVFITVKKHVFKTFFSQINVFNMYGVYVSVRNKS